MGSMSPTESLKRVTQVTKDVAIDDFKQVRDELFKLDDDIKVVLSDMYDRTEELRKYRMRIVSECQLIDTAFVELDRIYAGPRGQTSAKTMTEYIKGIRELKSLLENKQLLKTLKVLCGEPK